MKAVRTRPGEQARADLRGEERAGTSVGTTLLLRAEGLAVLLLSSWLYAEHGRGWLLFVVLFFVPDVAMLGYLRDPRLGAVLYNLAHTYLAPATLLGLGLLLQHTVLLTLGLIWAAHIGLDRMLGYGLKYPTAFQDTHLGRIGRTRAP